MNFVKLFTNQKKVRSKILENNFTILYRNKFNNKAGKSYSGHGSELEVTAQIREAIPETLKKLGCKSMLDAPCGDHHWVKEIKLPVRTYIGVDIVPELIDRNQKKYGRPQKKFMVADISGSKLPKTDIILCRDCFVHLPLKIVVDSLKNFKKSGAKYLLTTTFTSVRKNTDVTLPGPEWRALNFCKSPFYFPKPLMLINEGGQETKDKSLGLWELQKLNLTKIKLD